ncbi:transposase [Nocardioides sp. Root1257]|uniref:IS481 family transposase n=1 Tax=unclassified Nocardioides TaxID=2615069 RepID=UPI0006F86115|nr:MULTISPECIES: IS481 family transposase [unclassified Nocardioides]KQW53791.1 transposase [Nocardioides sp. Root1257]KRC56478.1 transposase [Nocardioides sp. Root224]
MSKARLVITAVTLENRTVAEVVATYGVSRSWVYELLARYRDEGEAAYEPRSKAPKTTPGATPPQTVDLVLRLRKQLLEAGHDAGADTLGWHLTHHHQITLSRATIHRILTRAGVVTPEPKKRPKSSYIRFQAAMPNQTWQSDFTHYRLSTGQNTEIITWLDDCTRYALHVSAHRAITTPIVVNTFRTAAGQHGIPASTLTDNGMVYTVRLASIGHRGGRNGFEQQLRDWHVAQKNSRPNHPTTCGKVERFQQTLKKWLRAQPDQPATIADLQDLIDRFVTAYNQHRPHRSLPHRATPATIYESMPKAVPGPTRDTETHDRIRHDIVDKSGSVTPRVNGQLRHIGIGRTHARTHVILLVQDRDVRVINAITGELLRELTIDPSKDYQPRTPK